MQPYNLVLLNDYQTLPKLVVPRCFSSDCTNKTVNGTCQAYGFKEHRITYGLRSVNGKTEGWLHEP